jgi:hypothetical protein
MEFLKTFVITVKKIVHFKNPGGGGGVMTYLGEGGLGSIQHI